MRRWVAIAMFASSLAHGDQAPAYLDVKPPWVQVTLPGKPARGELTLRCDADEPIAATTVRDDPQPIAIALVVHGQEVWLGNDDYALDAQYPGILKSLEQALDRADLGAHAPHGSKVVVITYANGAEVKLPMTDAGKLAGKVLGAQTDYRGKVSSDLVEGVTIALDELAAVDLPRKALIVIGDGTDTNPDEAAKQLPALGTRARNERVDTFAIIYKSRVSPDASSLTEMIAEAKTIAGPDELEPALAAIGDKLGTRYEVLFDARELPWDGRAHLLEVRDGSHPVVMDRAPLAVWNAPPVWWKAPWRWAVIGSGAAALVVLALLLRSRLRVARAHGS